MRMSLLFDEIDKTRGQEIAKQLDAQISKIPNCATRYNKDYESLGIICRVNHLRNIHKIMYQVCTEKELEVM